MVELTPDDQALVERVRKDWDRAEKVHKPIRKKWAHWYQLYRSCRDLRQHITDPRGPGVDQGLREARSLFGPELFIPISYWTVETVLPRMLSRSPRMLVLPKRQSKPENAQNMKYLIEQQQDQVDLELKLQDIGKDGLIYGLGIGKSYWRRDARRMKAVQRSADGSKFVVGEAERVLFDDPDAEAVDPFDFLWDPNGYDMRSCEFVVHRTWRSTKYVMDKLKSGAWANVGLTEDDVKELGPADRQAYDDVWQDRLAASGHSMDTRRGEQLHEVWEYHDREQVVIVLDRKVPVAHGPNPMWHGDLPFVIFRPTRVSKMMVGIGEIEPLEDLQEELNTLRTQRRDNAALVVNRVFAYMDGLVEQDDLQFFPGAMIPVEGDPRELLFPIPVGDLPASSYQEEDRMMQDVERTSGISDSVTGAEGGGTSETATGAQLVHAAANVRIQNKTLLLEKECLRHLARQWGALNQQHIIEAGQAGVRIPLPPVPGDAERRWSWRPLGPEELAGEFDYSAEGGSTAPENVPQMRQDAQMLWTLLRGNPDIDQRMLLRDVLMKFGVDAPDAWMAPEQRVPPMALELLGSWMADQKHIPEEEVRQAIAAAVGQASQQEAAQQGQGQPAAQTDGGQ